MENTLLSKNSYRNCAILTQSSLQIATRRLWLASLHPQTSQRTQK